MASVVDALAGLRRHAAAHGLYVDPYVSNVPRHAFEQMPGAGPIRTITPPDRSPFWARDVDGITLLCKEPPASLMPDSATSPTDTPKAPPTEEGTP